MRKQRGITMIGWIFLLAPMAVVLYAAIRVGPEYFNYYKVVTALNDTAKQLGTEDQLSQAAITSTLDKRFDTGYITEPKIQQIAISRQGEAWQVTAEWEKPVPLFGNMYLLLDFEKTVVID